jgi:hypothetical protein
MRLASCGAVEIQDVIGNAFDAAMVTRTYDVLRGEHRGNRHRVGFQKSA